MLNEQIDSQATRIDSRWTIVTLIAFSLLIALVRLAFLHDLPEWDASTYIVVGREITLGQRLYQDIWDMKPPAIFSTYALALWAIPSEVWAKYLLGVVPAIIVLFAIHSAARLIQPRAATGAAALWVVLCSQPVLGEDIANVEIFMNACFALALAMMLRLQAREQSAQWLLYAALIGAIWAIASLYKHISVFPAAGLCAAAVFTATRGRARRRAILQSCVILSIVPIGWLLAIAYFAATSRLALFVNTAWVYPRYYSGNMAVNLLEGFRPSHWFPARSSVELLPLAALPVPCIVTLKRWRTLPREKWFLAAMLIGCFAALATPGQFADHYYQLWLVPLCVIGGLAMRDLDRFNQRSPSMRRLLRAVPFLIVGGLAVMQAHWFFDTPRQRAIERYPASIFLTVNDNAEKIGQLLRPEETMYAWCDEAELYLQSHHRPAAAGLWKMHTVNGPVSTWLTNRTVEMLALHPPDLIVLWAWYPGPEDHPIFRFVAENYVALPDSLQAYPLKMCARRGSNLARRTKAAGALYSAADAGKT